MSTATNDLQLPATSNSDQSSNSGSSLFNSTSTTPSSSTPPTSDLDMASKSDLLAFPQQPQPRYLAPPQISKDYDPKKALDDLPGVAYALDLFMASQMHESEDFCHRSDVKKERLYLSTGFGLIQCVKAMMSYADEDLLAAIGHTKQGNLIAAQHRKKTAFLGTRLAGLVVSSLNTSGVGFVKSMTAVERHAELVYAESLVEKAILGIVYSGDWLAFIKEALNMRTSMRIYHQLYQYLEEMDGQAVAKGQGPEDKSIDMHFRSGVYLGIGTCNLILSLMPGKLLTLVELFGYHGDRMKGLELLMKAGGWSKGNPEPSIGIAEEGVRRTICDMSLLIFHLVLSSFTFNGVDITIAQSILDWNLKRYPNGVFFLFGAGRLALCRSQPQSAIEYYTKAMESQSQYQNLHHISYWEIAIANLALWKLPESLDCWKKLEEEATWSKSIYTYGHAVCHLEIGDPERAKEVESLMEKVPKLRQKIAGKSIPLEKFVARKARKYQTQGNRLTLPALEIAYLFMAIAHAPRAIITSKMLVEIQTVLDKLERMKDDLAKYDVGGSDGYWEDLCLARFLQGVCLRYVAYPDADAVLDPNEVVTMNKEEAEAGALAAFHAVFEHGPKIMLDHYIVYHAHYELGRLLACQGDLVAAKTQFDLVLSGKSLEVGSSGKGKYSMENALHMRTHAAVDALHQNRL